ncbi:SMP-30/gluconolactonase/LRE family protein [Paenibacillus ehimensis]|uniref:SMP-30/gluconolactonase/LRE family protein n=1 Tax=Paenibacillus ehimensis TaxID=79264 RepID=UPI00046FBE29|nr:SMP-30/gluconolactonase/LRE family protein [Paenibacillus ehimensis]
MESWQLTAELILDTKAALGEGPVWDHRSGRLLWVDIEGMRVHHYDPVQRTDRSIQLNQRVGAAVPRAEGEGIPDGMAVDREGMLWVAQWGGWRVSCWNPQSGERLGFVRVPAAQTTSCAFGGPDWDELYITTARTGLSGEQLAQQPHAGGLFCVKTGVKGRPACFYGG